MNITNPPRAYIKHSSIEFSVGLLGQALVNCSTSILDPSVQMALAQSLGKIVKTSEINLKACFSSHVGGVGGGEWG